MIKAQALTLLQNVPDEDLLDAIHTLQHVVKQRKSTAQNDPMLEKIRNLYFQSAHTTDERQIGILRKIAGLILDDGHMTNVAKEGQRWRHRIAELWGDLGEPHVRQR